MSRSKTHINADVGKDRKEWLYKASGERTKEKGRRVTITDVLMDLIDAEIAREEDKS